MPEETPMNLDEYMAKGLGRARHGPKCWLCSIPERGVVDKALRNGASTGVIRRWLIDECKYPPSMVNRGRIENHRYGGHHEQD